MSGAPGAWCACGPGTGWPRVEPALHHLDLVGLRDLDALCQQPHVVTPCPLGQQGGHLERLRVVTDHTLHEPYIGGREPYARQIRGIFSRNHAGGLSGRARLDDLRAAASVGGATGADGHGQQKREQNLYRAIHQLSLASCPRIHPGVGGCGIMPGGVLAPLAGAQLRPCDPRDPRPV